MKNILISDIPKKNKVKYRQIVLSSVFCIFLLINVPFCKLNPVSGSEYLYTGTSAAALASAGSGAARFDDITLAGLNPSAASRLLRNNITASWGLFGNFHTFFGMASIPTLWGVISGSYTGIFSLSENSADIGKLHKVKINFSKDISEEWNFGMSFNALIGSQNNTNPFGAGADLGLIKTRKFTGRSKFYLDEFRYSLVLANLGISASYRNIPGFENTDRLEPMRLTGGVFLGFAKIGPWRLDYSADLSLCALPFNLLINTALGSTFTFNKILHSIFIGGGYIFSGDIGTPNIGPWSAGARFCFRFNKTDLVVSYTLFPEKTSGAGKIAHLFALGAALGKIDKTSPQIEIQSENGEAVKE
ncbi:MAG: hypothetical protein A2096_13260 [Spirochaetes bacterium GWF1_41_5]|nr:MAG: hypothetical protein A2096_13260 [Spirochaetes bacterium GWF1_41_5]HBE03857.1 hypothetical protein [Spirochaetia bacterium]